MDLVPTVPSPEALSDAVANVWDRLVRGHLADLRRMPSAIVDEGPQRTLRRYYPPPGRRELTGPPILLVPPLAAPAICFDLRRGCSLVEYLVGRGHPTYLIDYGEIAFADKDLGLEHWVDEVIPTSVRKVAEDAGGEPVHLVGWSLGGIMALLVAADQPDLPLRSVSMFGSPFDVTEVPLVAPLRPLVNVANGAALGIIYRVLGGAPAPIVKRAYQLAGAEKYVTKPLALLRHLDDRDFLAQIEAVDYFMDHMLAYPGRTFGQLYHRVLRTNDLAAGSLKLGTRRIELADVRAPVLSLAGAGDGIAPVKSVHHVGELLPNAETVELATAPGGHLGVLTGRAARRTSWPTLEAFVNAHAARPKRRRRPKRAAA